MLPLDLHLSSQLQTWITRGTALKPINVLMVTGKFIKTGTLTTTFHKPVGEANIYVQFIYIPLINFNHTRGEVHYKWTLIQLIWYIRVKNIKISERRTWWRFCIKQRNKMKQTCLNTQPATLIQPSTNLLGKKICMSGLDTAHRKFPNTPKDNFQYKWMPIHSKWTNRSKFIDGNMIAKTPKNNIWWTNNLKNNNNLYLFNCSSINQGW